MIGIIGAMDIEVEFLKNSAKNKEIKKVSGIDFVKGEIYGKEVVIAKAGVGKVNAAICAQTMALLYKPDVIINTGVAGSLSKEVGVGDIVIAEDTVQHDMDTSPLGDPVGFISGIDMVKLPCHKPTVNALSVAADEVGGIKYKTGTIASGDIFLNSEEIKNKIVKNFGAIAGEMEGASIGQVCIVNNIPYCVVRAISDNADGSSHMDYPEFVGIAAKKSADLIMKYIKNYK